MHKFVILPNSKIEGYMLDQDNEKRMIIKLE